MVTDKVKAFFEALRTDPKAKELIKNLSAPEKPEGIPAVYEQLARDLGYDVTAAEIQEALKAMEQNVKAKTESAADQIQKLSDDEVTEVAGGKREHRNCLDTFRDKENCTLTDGCDVVFIYYENYYCNWHNLGIDEPLF